jgi:hypothetical protein
LHSEAREKAVWCAGGQTSPTDVHFCTSDFHGEERVVRATRRATKEALIVLFVFTVKLAAVGGPLFINGTAFGFFVVVNALEKELRALDNSNPVKVGILLVVSFVEISDVGFRIFPRFVRVGPSYAAFPAPVTNVMAHQNRSSGSLADY